MTEKMHRKYTEKDVKRLVASAGGRCSYRYKGEICKRLLVSNNSVIGEKAHIEAIGKKGARHNPDISEEEVNSYDNLMWMCPTHHRMIDKLDDVHIYTVNMLIQMKKDHEKDIELGYHGTSATLYDSVIHDYSALSTLFYYVDINKLYSSSIDLPRFFDTEFGKLNEMVEYYSTDLGKFYLRDQYLNKLFVRMLDSERVLWNTLQQRFDIDYVPNGENPIQKFECKLKQSNTNADINWVNYLTCSYQENVDNFINAIRNRYPEILYTPVYDPRSCK
ncbi:HNH endonuclease [Vibrio vulnificus]|uniref:HNH endonuclease n=1 Tax=Vibrio vulnificus TaxID=672 RepID=UPI000698E0C5|nr:HNH endonuclease [Vibrio vulnificus]EGR1425925.1 HNH endonuclease [Vibrio vulnificus]MCU8260498.1 HNH endonuclease [Vibrio vulnificus]MCU8422096.1 HNH endonuclease [Vibrio vulnificus]